MEERIAVEVKGTAIISIPLFIKERFSVGGLNQWIDALTPEARKVYPASVLVSSWYPLKELLIEPLRKMCGLFYAGDLKGARESGRFSADYSLKGIYKIFVKLGSPGVHAAPGGHHPADLLHSERDESGGVPKRPGHHADHPVPGYGSSFGDPHRGLDGTRHRDQWRQTA